MTIDLKKYLTEQYHKTISDSKKPGPVITISRQYGCSAKEIAVRLSKKLNDIRSEKDKIMKWTWINKEVFKGTAKALNLKESRVLHVFEGEKKSIMESILLSSSERYYATDTKIKKKIIEIVRSFAEQGHVIIIGLGSVVINRDIERSLHIRLEAPFKWRVDKAAQKQMRSLEDMKHYTTKIDKQRDNLRNSFKIKENPDEMFDLRFNVMTLSEDEIVDTIVKIMKKRKLI